MALSVGHAFNSAVADGGNTALVQPSDWNAAHTLTGAASIAQGGTNATSFTSTAINYFDGTSVASMAGTAWDNTNRSLVLTGATVTTSKPVLDLSQTWNAGAVAFTGLKFNVTNTASSFANCALLDLQIGGTSQFKVSDRAELVVGTGQGFGNAFVITGAYTGSGANGVSFAPVVGAAGAEYFYSDSLSTQVASGNYLGMSGTGHASALADVRLYRDAAGILAQRNSTSAQALRVYNTYTDASNYERGGFDWATTANTLRIRSENLGTGTNRIIAIDAFAKAGAAVAGDIPSGTWAVVRDTSGSTTKLIYNNAGTLMTVALA